MFKFTFWDYLKFFVQSFLKICHSLISRQDKKSREKRVLHFHSQIYVHLLFLVWCCITPIYSGRSHRRWCPLSWIYMLTGVICDLCRVIQGRTVGRRDRGSIPLPDFSRNISKTFKRPWITTPPSRIFRPSYNPAG